MKQMTALMIKSFQRTQCLLQSTVDLIRDEHCQQWQHLKLSLAVALAEVLLPLVVVRQVVARKTRPGTGTGGQGGSSSGSVRNASGEAAAAPEEPAVAAAAARRGAAGAALGSGAPCRQQVRVRHLVLVAGDVNVLGDVILGEQARVGGAQGLTGDLGEDTAGPLLSDEGGRWQRLLEAFSGIVLEQLLLLLQLLLVLEQEVRLVVGDDVEGRAVLPRRVGSRARQPLVLLLDDADDDDDEEQEDGDGQADDQDENRQRLLGGIRTPGRWDDLVREDSRV